MRPAWVPADDELDAIARSNPAPMPTPDGAEQMRTRLLAAQPSVAQRRARKLWPAMAGVAVAISAAAALIIWLSVRSTAVDEHGEPKAVVSAVTPSKFERRSEWPDYVVELEDGKVSVQVAALGAGERFRIRTRDSEIEVRGTQFIVEASHGELLAIVVDRGSIELRQPGQPAITVDAGHRWTRTQTAALPAPVPVPPAAATSPASPTAPVATASKPTVPRIAKQAPTETSSVKAAAPSATKPATTATVTSAAAQGNPRGASGVPASAQPAITTQVTTTPNPIAGAKPGELDFRAGWSALRAGKATEATASFTAACGAAQKEAFGEDACFWRGVAAKRAGQTKVARAALTQFLAQFPKSARAAEASALLGWELYDAGELDVAERYFRAAVNDRVPKVRDSAQRGLTAVERRRKSP